MVVGCGGTPDLGSWRTSQANVRDANERLPLAQELRRVSELRSKFELAKSRELALRLAAENPGHPTICLIASRAESDGVFLFPRSEQEKRDLAALSALDFAKQAVGDSTLPSQEMLAQYAWALGTSTHLQPMFDRSDHAKKTLEVVKLALKKNGDSPTALATFATLRLRLATLPWIAKVMASDAPEGSIEGAERMARQCVELEPSVEYRLLHAKTLVAAERVDEARKVLAAALEAEPKYPRDRVLRGEVEAFAAEIGEASE